MSLCTSLQLERMYAQENIARTGHAAQNHDQLAYRGCRLLWGCPVGAAQSRCSLLRLPPASVSLAAAHREIAEIRSALPPSFACHFHKREAGRLHAPRPPARSIKQLGVVWFYLPASCSCGRPESLCLLWTVWGWFPTSFLAPSIWPLNLFPRHGQPSELWRGGIACSCLKQFGLAL